MLCLNQFFPPMPAALFVKNFSHAHKANAHTAAKVRNARIIFQAAMNLGGEPGGASSFNLKPFLHNLDDPFLLAAVSSLQMFKSSNVFTITHVINPFNIKRMRQKQDQVKLHSFNYRILSLHAKQYNISLYCSYWPVAADPRSVKILPSLARYRPRCRQCARTS